MRFERTIPAPRRTLAILILAATLAVAAVVPAVGASAGSVRTVLPQRAVRAAAGGDMRYQTPGAGSGHAAAAAIPGDVRLLTVDTARWSGYENAVYAPDGRTIFIAYKRFLTDPTIPGYTPAELRVARSVDGGQTWAIQVVDADAIEAGDTLEGSVSIDGDGASTVYVAYHVRASGLFADMELRVATSTDGGDTWTTQTVADEGAGDYNSIVVLDAGTVAVSAHASGAEEGLHVFLTGNGGATWTDRLIEGGIGNGWYTSIGASGLRSVTVSYYNGLFPDHTDLNAARRRGQQWLTSVVDGSPGDLDLTGLGSSIEVGAGPTVWIAYEADTTQGTFVRVAKRSPGDPAWSIVPVEQGSTIGWNTAIHSPDADNVYVSYWRTVGSLGQAAFAVSSDGGATWTPTTVPEPRNVNPYLDSAAPSAEVQFLSYQVSVSGPAQAVLRLARIDSP